MRLSGLERAARPSSQGRALEPAGDHRPREMTVAPQGEQNPAYSPESLFYRKFRYGGTSLFFGIAMSGKCCTFAPDLAKGMPCESATVPAAVSPRKACQSCHCPAPPDGKATGSDKSEDLPNREFNCKPSGTRATLSAAISMASCDGLAVFVSCVITFFYA